MFKYLFIIFISMFIISCSQSDVNTNKNEDIGYLIDAKVSGVQYECNNIQGITKIDGSFNFDYVCDEIVFKIGAITLASIPSSQIPFDNKFFISDIIDNNERNDSNNTSVKNIIRLLQTLDEDMNPENGIHISKTTRNNIQDTSAHKISSPLISETDLENIIKDSDLNRTLVSPIKALVHFEQTLRDNNIHVDTVPPYKPSLQKTLLASSKEDNIFVNIIGEKNTYIYLDGNNTNLKLNKFGIFEDFTLNISGDSNIFYDFNISLKDEHLMSETLQLHILKDREDIEKYDNFSFSASYDINLSEGNTSVFKIKIKDDSEDHNLSLIYKITGNDKDLFDVNSSSKMLYFLNDINNIETRIHKIQIRVSDEADHFIQSGDIDINVIN